MRRAASFSPGSGKTRIQRTGTFVRRPYFFKEILDDKENAFSVGVGPGSSGGWLRGLRAVCGRSGLQGELPELSRFGGDTESGHREGHGREASQRSGVQEDQRSRYDRGREEWQGQDEGVLGQ